MSTDPHPDAGGSNTTFRSPSDEFDPYRHPRRIYLLDLLRTQPSAEIRPLARRLVARERACPPETVADAAADGAYVDLIHNHLPRLEEHGLVTVDRESGAVTCQGEIPPSVPSVAELLAEYPADDRRRVLDTLLHPTRMAIVSILRGSDGTVPVSQLADRLATRERTPVSDATRARIELHHRHLPAMEGIGLLTYDATSTEIVGLGEMLQTVR